MYTLEQRWEILRHYFENRGNVAECARKLRTNFGRREVPSASYIRYLVKKVKETGILIDKPKRDKAKTVRTPENIAAVTESVCETPLTSIHRRSQQLNISETLLRRILHRDLGMMAYKVQLVQEIDLRSTYTEDADFGKKKSFFQMKLIFILAGM